MKETTITRSILKALNSLPRTWAIKIHGGPFQRAGVPDILCVYANGAEEIGHTLFLEVKRPGEIPSKIQARTAQEMTTAGARVFVVHSVAEALEAVGNSSSGKLRARTELNSKDPY